MLIPNKGHASVERLSDRDNLGQVFIKTVKLSKTEPMKTYGFIVNQNLLKPAIARA